MTTPPTTQPLFLSLGEQRANRRALLLGEVRGRLAARGWTADSPVTLTDKAEQTYRLERADYDGGEG